MTTLLRIDASARTGRSLSRALADRFVAEWRALRPDDSVILRDVGRTPPPAIDEDWIAAAFTPEPERTEAHRDRLALSDQLIDELERAGVIVVATPMYNYGMPAALKGWVDQVIRVNRTFTFDLARGDWPLEPALSGKTLVLLSSSGEFGFAPGGMRADMDHLHPHIRTVSRYLGVETIHALAVEGQEFGDARHRASIAAAQAAVPRLVADLTARPARAAA